MTSWIAIGFGIFCGLFSLWLWFFGYDWTNRHLSSRPDGAPGRHTPESIRRWAKVFAIGGAVATVLMLWVGSLGSTTVYETEVVGSVGLQRGEKVRGQEMEFFVAHPQVAHKIQLWPKEGDDAAVTKKKWGVVKFVAKVTGPSGEPVHFESITAKNGGVAETVFTPTKRGRHKLEVAALTLGVAKIHVLVSDRAKNGGQRMKGF
jgi:hypothetical protein